MSVPGFYHAGQRELQTAQQSAAIADRLASFVRSEFTADDVEFIHAVPFFWLATADADGQPDCSFKGGPPGFLQVTGPSELAFPDYDGNGMFRSLGNVLVNPRVALLLIAIGEYPYRLRINGTAEVRREDPLLATTVAAQLIIRVTATAIFPNCPRYIPRLELVAPSRFTPRPGCLPVEPEWKQDPLFADAMHPRQATFLGEPAPPEG